MATSTLHIVSKHDNTKTATCPLPTATLPPLAPSSVRVRASALSLTSNNLSYARGGALLHWWSAYPVPVAAPAPYDSAADWGVVPAWGHATVLASTIPSIAPGSTLWGFWPASGHPVDLQLRAAEAPAGHWIEGSAHRAKLMSLYNRYVQLPQPLAGSDDALDAAVAFKPVWEAGYLANRFVFPADESLAPVHPLGLGGEWTKEDADLSAAVVVSLSAASTTARGFAWQLARNRDGAADGPRALLQVTSAPDSLAAHADTQLAIKNVAYAEAASAETVAWIAGFAPRRVVIMDFGADEKVTEELLAALNGAGAFAERPAVAVVAVGWEPKVYSDAEMQARHAAKRELGMVQFNASGIKDRAMEAVGPAVYFRDVAQAWERCCREAGLGNLEILYRDGVEGAQGIEGAWRDLCDRKVPPNKVMVVRLPLD